MKPTRLTAFLAFAALVLCLAAVAGGAPPVGPQRAAAAEEGETTTTPAEPPAEPPPVVETPTQIPPPVVETPVTPPISTESPSSGTTTTPSETKSPSSSGSTESSSTGGGNSGGSGATTTGAATTAPSAGGGHRASHVRATPTDTSGGSAHAPAGGSKPASGGGGAGGAGNEGGGHHAAAPAPVVHQQPSVSPQGIDEGASAVSNVAAHVGEVFAETIPTAPLKKIGDRLAAHIGLTPKQDGKGGKGDANRIGTAIGAALLGSAVAVQRPAPSHSSIPFLGSPSGGSETIYLILLAAVLLVVAVFVVREVRKALGLRVAGPVTPMPGQKPRLALSKPRVGAGDLAIGIMARARDAGEQSLRAFRRLSANAVSGVRSLF